MGRGSSKITAVMVIIILFAMFSFMMLGATLIDRNAKHKFLDKVLPTWVAPASPNPYHQDK